MKEIPEIAKMYKDFVPNQAFIDEVLAIKSKEDLIRLLKKNEGMYEMAPYTILRNTGYSDPKTQGKVDDKYVEKLPNGAHIVEKSNQFSVNAVLVGTLGTGIDPNTEERVQVYTDIIENCINPSFAAATLHPYRK